MRNNLLVILLFIVILVCGSCDNSKKRASVSESFIENKTGDVVLGVSSKIIDFGKVNTTKSKSLNLSVSVTNEGKKTLVLQKADVSCGCMEVKLDKNVLRASEKAQVKIIVKTEGNDGYFNKAVFITSNAKNSPEIIRVKGEFFSN